MIDDYPDTFAVVEYHVRDAYATEWGEARGVFCTIWSDGIPWFAYDGLFDAWPISSYVSNFLARRAVPTSVTMETLVTPVSGDLYRITTDICLEAGADPLDVRVYAVVVEDHWPTSPSYSRNTFRAATPTVDITLEPGRCYRDTREVTLDPGWILDDLKVIAWVQEPLEHIPAEVHQAAKAHGPFDLLIGDLDGDGDVDLSDLATLLAHYGVASGATYEDGDLDGDGDVDLADLAGLLAVYGTGV